LDKNHNTQTRPNPPILLPILSLVRLCGFSQNSLKPRNTTTIKSTTHQVARAWRKHPHKQNPSPKKFPAKQHKKGGKKHLKKKNIIKKIYIKNSKKEKTKKKKKTNPKKKKKKKKRKKKKNKKLA